MSNLNGIVLKIKANSKNLPPVIKVDNKIIKVV
jgi:hypothetical protein